MKALPWIFLLWGTLLLGVRPGAAGDPAGFAVAYFPEAAYRDERATYVIEGPAGAEVTASLDGREIGRGVCRAGTLELNLVLRGGGNLVFRQGAAAIGFHVVTPEAPVVLREERGYLHSDRGPAILLARHLHPPKHDRRWETLTFLKRMFSDARPEVYSGTILIPDRLFASEPGGWERTLGLDPAFWTVLSLKDAGSEIHALIASGVRLRASDILVVALSDTDLEQGADALQLRIKLEWYFQRIRPVGYRHVFVVGPLVDHMQRERFSPFIESLKLAAAGNGVSPVSLPSRRGDRSWSPQDWAGVVRREVGRKVKPVRRSTGR